MNEYRKKKTIWKNFLRWGLLVLGLSLGVGGVWSFCVESNRNYGQLATSLITISGVVLTLWMAHERAIEQQEKEDERHNARLDSEATRHDERLRAEAKMQDERLIAEAQKDRAQRSITQRIDLAEKLAAAIEHLYDEKELKQAAGVQEVLFQIDDWHALIESEITGIKGDKAKKDMLEQEGLRRRQELFDIAYKFDTKNIALLKSRARGLRQRLMVDGDHSLIGLDFSGIVIGSDGVRLDLRDIKIGELVMADCGMRMVDLRCARLDDALLLRSDFYCANLEYAELKNAKLLKVNFECVILRKANLNSADLEGALLKGADLSGATLVSACLKSVNMKSAIVDGANFADAMYNRATIFPEGFVPGEHGMILIDDMEAES